MRRRDLLALLGAGSTIRPFAVGAQQPKIPIVGVLSPGKPEQGAAPVLAAWRNALGEAGFVEGRNIDVEYRWAGTDHSQLPGFAADLVAHGVAVIWSPTNDAAAAAKKATASIPIVFCYVIDPVGAKLVESLDRPGGNATGIGSFEEALVARRLELLHELVPDARRIGYLVADQHSPSRRGELERFTAAGAALGIDVTVVSVDKAEEIESVLATGKRTGIGAIVIQAHPIFLAEQKRLVELCARYTLPASRLGLFAEQGGLMSYGPQREQVAYQAGSYVARILNGAKPAELPVMPPTKFRLVVNLKTAKELGLTVPQSLLARADKVIE